MQKVTSSVLPPADSAWSDEHKNMTDERRHSYLERMLLPRLQRKDFNPMGHNLALIDWSVFGTLTFTDEKFILDTDDAEKLRISAFKKCLSDCCKRHGFRFRNLAWYCKSEFGLDGRGHIHFLVGCRGTEEIHSEILAASMREFWAHGMALIEPYRHYWKVEGACYQSKNEHDKRGQQILVPEYLSPELKKIIMQANSRNN